ncbi:endonuclease/exonuclease/phosphatase family protein [Streptomyces albidochromogenes]|uniref:Endonuclease/exonuclease/phosphatase family protein n=2 Tax=Streptomyces albidochromogenes TaxID=329524 RepID=A0ABW6FUW8_9ACTN
MRASRWGWRGWGPAAVAVVVAGLLAFPSAVPDMAGRPGSLLETFLPWLGVCVPVLLVLSWWRRSLAGLVALMLPVAAWVAGFGGMLAGGSAYDLVVVQHNVSDENGDPAGTARALTKVRPGLVALEELTPDDAAVYASVLRADYPHHAVVGTVGLWSKYPLTDVRPVDIRPAGVGAGWNRGLRAEARMPGREAVAVYVAHLPSVRMGPAGFGAGRRDESARLLGAALADEPRQRVILLGDLNGTVDDRGLDPVGEQVASGPGFAFSWPARFPVARIDQVMTRRATVTEVWSLPATGSDHLPVAARIRW